MASSRYRVDSCIDRQCTHRIRQHRSRTTTAPFLAATFTASVSPWSRSSQKTYTATVGDCTGPLPPLPRWRTGRVYGTRALGCLTRFSFLDNVPGLSAARRSRGLHHTHLPYAYFPHRQALRALSVPLARGPKKRSSHATHSSMAEWVLRGLGHSHCMRMRRSRNVCGGRGRVMFFSGRCWHAVAGCSRHATRMPLGRPARQ